MAIEDGAKRPLFLEDDVVFQREIPTPPEYDVLYLGGHPRKKVLPYGKDLYKIKSFSCAEAYSLTNPAEYFYFWLDRVGRPQAMYDFVLSDYAKTRLGLAYYPTITMQRPGFSQIGKKQDDKKDLIQRGWRTNL